MMSFETVMFVILATLTGGSSVAVVLSRQMVRAAVWLLITLIGVSGLYFYLGAEFLGATQLIVYVGGTLVLVVFGVMLTEPGKTERVTVGPTGWCLAGFLSASMFFLLVLVMLNSGKSSSPAVDEATEWPGVGPIGLAFLGLPQSPNQPGYLLPFELISVHLLVVLIGAAYLARAKRKPASEAGGTVVRLEPVPDAGEGESL
jgi:NADH-quinone oxidoreductase subunit J